MTHCLACLGPVKGDAPVDQYHPRCARRLFGSTRIPRADDALVAAIGAIEVAVDDRTARPRGRPAITVGISPDKRRLSTWPEAGQFALKIQSIDLPQLPENELLTMRLSEMVGVEIPPCGLVRLADGSLACLVRQFEVLGPGENRRREDFRTLTREFLTATPDDSAELCAGIARRHASEPLVALLKLYRLFVAAWWTGNGGLRLEDFAFDTGPDGLRSLAPARDLVCTRLVTSDDRLGLPVGGKRGHLTRADWVRFSDTCGLRPRIVERVLDRVISSFDEALELISGSFLSDDRKILYAEMLGRHTARLEEG